MLRLKQEEEENRPTRYEVPQPPVASELVEPSVPPVRHQADVQASHPSTTAQSSTSEQELQAYIRAAQQQAAQAQQVSQTQQAATATASSMLPSVIDWYHHLVTNNPVFHKEVLSQKRVQEKKQATTRTTERALGGMALVGLYVGFFYLIAKIVELGGTSSQTSAGWTLHTFLLVIQFLVMVLALPLQAATMITQEREKMTWNALLLARLSPLQILVGKGVAALRPLLVTMAMLLPALIISGVVAQVTLKGMIAAQAILLLTAVLNVTIALSCSLFSKKSQQASGNAGGAVMLTLLGFPAASGIIEAGPWIAYTVMNGGSSIGYNPPIWFHYLAALPNLFNPAVATFFGISDPSALTGLPPYLWFLVPTFFVMAAAGTTWVLWKRMLDQFQKAPKDFSG